MVYFEAERVSEFVGCGSGACCGSGDGESFWWHLRTEAEAVFVWEVSWLVVRIVRGAEGGGGGCCAVVVEGLCSGCGLVAQMVPFGDSLDGGLRDRSRSPAAIGSL